MRIFIHLLITALLGSFICESNEKKLDEFSVAQEFKDKTFLNQINTAFKSHDQKDKSTTGKYPVILVPGDGGNQLYGRLNKTTGPHYFCERKSSDYLEIWLDIENLPPYLIDCLVDNLRLVYDNQTKTTSDSPGVDIKVKDFGQPDTVEFIDSSRLSASNYFGSISDALVKKANYTRGVNIRGAPYDWRKAPNELNEFYKNLTSLVEETYYINNGTKVMLIAHSMGNPVILYWLNRHVTAAWKEKFIQNFVSISGVWGGAAKPIRLMTSGDSLDIILVRPFRARPYQRSAVSTAFLMPSDKFWPADEVILSTPKRNYTVNDYEQFFNDIKYPIGYELRKNTGNLIYDLTPPGVEIHCLYGVKVKTPEKFIYNKQSEFPDYQPSVVYGDGDGTVNIRSLLGYRRWIGKQLQPIYFKEFAGAEHLQTLRHQPVIDYIINLVNN